MANVTLDRDALYYPYIHIRDVNWLKATLLSFPQVRRMVPPSFHLNDNPEVQIFREVENKRGEPLLQDEPTETQSGYIAQQNLREKLAGKEDFLVERYSKSQTEADYGNTSTFQMYRSKMHELLNFLEERDLAWHEWEIRKDTAGDWFGLHPQLGEAIMSVMAINIARDQGLDIVTSSGRVNHALTSFDEDAVINNVLGTYSQPLIMPPGQPSLELTDELVQVFMTTFFDVSQLSAQQIGELNREGLTLQTFKDELLVIASRIPDIRDPEVREKRLTQAADEVLENWLQYKRSLPKYAAQALISGLEDIKVPDLVMSAVSGTSAGLSTGVVATTLLGGASVGLAVGFLVYGGINVWKAFQEKKNNPYQYLSKVEQAGAVLTIPTKEGQG